MVSYYKEDTYKSLRGIGYLLKRGGKLANARIEALFTGTEEITYTQWIVLMYLRDRVLVTAGEISQEMCHDSGALTRIIDQLEERKLLQRQRSTTDRRVVELELTDDGRQLTERFLPRLLALYNEIFDGFTKEEADQAISLLMRINHKLDTMGKEI